MLIALKVLLYFLGTFVFTLFLVKMLLGFAQSLGIRSKNDIHVRWSNTSKPSLGGIAIFISVFSAIVIYLISHPHENVFGDQRFLSFFIGVCMAFFMGLSDDAFNTKPLIKLFTQVLCGICLIWGEVVLPLSANYWINAFLTIIWVVGLMNSLNMLDNMDGITASIAINTFVFVIIFALVFNLSALNVYLFIMIGLLGSLAGFLLVNYPPSRLFMGDSGSQVLGFSIAYFTIFQGWMSPQEIPIWLKAFVLLLILAIPFIDTFTVTFNRISLGKSPAKGGKDHTTHHMVYRGFNEKSTFLIFWGLSALLGSLGLLMIYLFTLGFGNYVLILMIPFYLVFYFLFKNTHVYKAP
jgi:UDP-GlcNAc:undecaprenyl-phosphate/decaprenyl-phosphate GlcNAc-1-phosphate transferase